MSALTPADLARFVHPVPVGARFPMYVEFMEFRESEDYFRGPFNFPDATAIQQPDDPKRWTAEPLPAPKPSLAARARANAATARINSDVTLSNLALIVAELAERIEAER